MKQLKLNTISFLQKQLLKINCGFATDMYYELAKKHYLIHFGRNLTGDVCMNVDDAQKAAKRHARLVVKTLYKNSTPDTKKRIRAMARGSFIKNILLQVDVD